MDFTVICCTKSTKCITPGKNSASYCRVLLLLLLLFLIVLSVCDSLSSFVNMCHCSSFIIDHRALTLAR
jgi:hypothetical protein